MKRYLGHITLQCCLLLGVAAGAMSSCTGSVDTGPPFQAPEGMVWIAGTPEQAGFFMDATEVTVGQFQEFVEATNYVTEAEDFGWSGVFNKDSLAWLPIDSATFLYPLGPAPAASPENFPATQLSLRDVDAYLEWAGKALPTEQEWMHAASQSGKHQNYPWGEEMVPDGKYNGNWWQGPFPYEDQVLDEFPGAAPVKSFPPAANGLYDISGNVWEWTATTDRSGQQVIKGGSFLCSTSYCTGFNLSQRQLTPADSGLNHLGFRGIIRPQGGGPPVRH